jgi:hypothetical protein
LKELKMNNIRLQRVLTSMSLVTQAFGFDMLGFLMALRGGSDSGARIGGLLSVLTGTMFLVAAIAYWRTCHRQTRLGVLGIQDVASSAPALAGLDWLTKLRDVPRLTNNPMPDGPSPNLEEPATLFRIALPASF